MQKYGVAVAVAVVLLGGLALAQETMEGMDHSGMDQMDMNQIGTDQMGMAGHATQIPPELADNPAVQGYAAAMDKMMADMAVPFTGDADVDFVKGMIPHHEAAVAMAKVELEHGKDADIRALAEQVIAAQEAEIAMMKAWLAARGQ